VTVPLALLMALRVKGRAAASALATATGTSETALGATLDAARRRRLVTTGPDELYALTAEGHVELAVAVAAEVVDRTLLARAYDGFLAIDAELKQQISEWQLGRTSAARDRLAETAVAAARAVADLIGIVARLAPYADRLRAARAAVAGGDLRFVADPRLDSLHQIWFELHEDLLVTLDRPRAA